MHFIIGDIGNTSTRICVLNNKSKIIKSVILDTKKIFIQKYILIIFKKFLNKNVKKKFYFQVLYQMHLKKLNFILMVQTIKY